MFTMKTPTELVHRVFLTVLLVGILGNCAESPQELGAESQEGIKINLQTPEQGDDQDAIANAEPVLKSIAIELQNGNNSSDYDKDDDINSSLSRSIPSYYSNTNTKNYGPNSNSNYDSYQGIPSSPLSSYYGSQRDRDRNRDRNYDRHGDISNNNRPLPSSIAAGMSTVISSTSYSIKPGSGGSGSNVYVNTKPVPIIVSSTGPTVGVGISMGGSRREENYYHANSRNTNYHNRPLVIPGQGSSPSAYYDFPKRDPSDFNRNNYDPSSVPLNSNLNFDCINGNGNRRNCPKGESYYNEDENRSYYAVLNGNLKHPYGSGIRRHDDEPMGSDSMSSERYQATFPFTVHGFVPDKERFYTDSEDSFPKRRVTRTSTTSSPPGWVKLQPISSRKTYDPFFSKEKEFSKKYGQQSKISKGGPNSDSSTDQNEPDNMKFDSHLSSQFANRIGTELSPESFAERWGWGSGGSGKGSGSRLPSWLEELNHQQKHSKGHNRRPAYGTAHTGPTRDEDPQNWVKLDPIPVAGVSISKWVPKGTSPHELPSTGNLIRDRPTAWWDSRPENSNPKRPTFLHQHLNKGNNNNNNNINMGWGSSSSTTSTTRFPILHPDRKPSGGGSWNDIIYPDTPTSATASWESSGINSIKGISTYPSSFPSTVSMGWKSDVSGESGSNNNNGQRRPVASWSAPGSSSNNRFGLRRPSVLQTNHHSGNPSSYPDPHAGEDDPRWVLVSNSRRVSGPHIHPVSDSHKYRPPLDRYKDDLDWDLDVSDSENDRNIESLYGSASHSYHRLAKDYKLPSELLAASSNLDSSSSSSSSTETVYPPIPEIYTQEEAFNRVNATLQSLMPVLNLSLRTSDNSTRTTRSTPRPKRRSKPNPTTETTTPGTTTTTSSLYNKIPASIRNSLSSLMGTGRQATADPLTNPTNGNGTKIVISRKPNSLKPILAAVGVGMIPATMAVLPMVMGKRKKREIINQNQNYAQPGSDQVHIMTPIIFQNQLYLLPSTHPSAHEDSKNSRVMRNNYKYDLIHKNVAKDVPVLNNWANFKEREQHRSRATVQTKSIISR